IRRTLKSDGGSRAFIGGSPVPAGLLRDVGALAVEIHGQHDDRGLLNPKGHRALLDAFGKLDNGAVATAWAEVTRIESELARARAEAAAAERDREFLEHASCEIAELAPEEGEETRLAEERAAMQAGVKAGESLTGLDELIGGSEGALALLRQAARRREQLAAIDAGGERIAELDRELIAARRTYAAAADRLSRERHEAATRLDAAVISELHPLKLDSAKFRTAIAPVEPGQSGTDRVEF